MRFLTCVLAVFLTLAGLDAQGRFENYPLPSRPDTLRILAVGNSFSDDGTEYLPGLLEAAGIHNVILARLYIGGCSLQRHCEEYEKGLKQYTYYKSTGNKWEIVSRSASLVDGLKDEPWDIITMQEASGYSGTYSNYAEWAPKLFEIIRRESANPRASIVWHETWAYASNSVHGMFKVYDKDQTKMYDAIVDCVRRITAELGIDVVIPCGDAIQAARGTRLNNDGVVPATCKVYQLTRDGFHLSHQFGRYTAACVWFEALLKPTLGVSVKGNGYLIRDTDYGISSADARLCQDCAVKAVRSW